MTERMLMHRRYAVITAKPVPQHPEDRPVFKTCGHDDINCSAIKPESRRLGTSTLMEHLEANEFFDGEVVYEEPFSCRVCTVDHRNYRGET